MEGQIKTMTKQEKTALASVLVNSILTISKFALASVSGSLALLAEAYHSLSDIASSGAVFIAVRADVRGPVTTGSRFWQFIQRKPQRKVAIGIGIFLLAVAVSIIRKVFRPVELGVGYPVIIGLAMLVLSLFSFLLSRFEREVGERTGSTALIADSHHARVDMLGSLLVALALFGESMLIPLDRLAAGIISVFIILQAVNVFVVVLRDMVKGEDRPDYVYPRWITAFSRNWKSVAKRFLCRPAGRFFRVAPDDPEFDRKAGHALIFMVVTILLLVYFLSGLFAVGPHQQAIVERCGRPLQREAPLGPGLHYHLPWPVDRVRKVDTLRVRRLVVGSEISPDSRTLLWTNIHYIREHNVLTGENIFVDSGMTLHYRIQNPYKYLYVGRQPESLLREVSYSVLLKLLAKWTFFKLITVDRDRVESILFDEIRQTMASHDLGIELLSVNLRDMHPPTNVAPDFEDVVSATVDHETYINEAKSYRNDLIPQARGKAEEMKWAAKALRIEKVEKSLGESSRFEKTLAIYRTAPIATRLRLLLEMTESVLKGCEKYIVPPEAADGALDLWLIQKDE